MCAFIFVAYLFLCLYFCWIWEAEKSGHKWEAARERVLNGRNLKKTGLQLCFNSLYLLGYFSEFLTWSAFQKILIYFTALRLINYLVAALVHKHFKKLTQPNISQFFKEWMQLYIALIKLKVFMWKSTFCWILYLLLVWDFSHKIHSILNSCKSILVKFDVVYQKL